MKKLQKIVFSALTLSTVTLSLASCGDNEGASTAMKNVFTVTYYDDAPTPVAIGYSYVIGGRAATFKNNDANSPYDYLSRSEKAPSAGKHYVFDEWKGSYENGDPVEVTVVFSKDNIKVDPEGILPSSIKILNQSFIGYNYFLEYELGDGAVRVIHARKQNSQLLEVSYSVGGEEVVTDSPFTIVEQSQ